MEPKGPRNIFTESSPTRNLETAHRKDHNSLFTKFWQELSEGKGTEKGERDVEELVAEYTDVNPLTPLSEEERRKVVQHLRYFFQSGIETYNEVYNDLINNQIILFEKNDARAHSFNISFRSTNTLLNISNIPLEVYNQIIRYSSRPAVRLLERDDKLRILADPEFLHQSQYYVWNPEFLKIWQRFFSSGSRRLTEQEGGYYSSPEEFKEEIRAVRERTGRLKLRVLDVGSNFGLALKDMKDLDPNIETFNMTIDEHPSLFGDHIVRHPAEMVPLEFEETMDLIDSQMAFRYFLYPDIALRNVIKSLSVGGVARIAFIFGGTVNCFPDPNSRVNLDDDERKNRQKVLWTQIKTFLY